VCPRISDVGNFHVEAQSVSDDISIVDDTNLGLSTVRTIVGKANGPAGGRPLNPTNDYQKTCRNRRKINSD
jgi:hypothetical protein